MFIRNWYTSRLYSSFSSTITGQASSTKQVDCVNTHSKHWRTSKYHTSEISRDAIQHQVAPGLFLSREVRAKWSILSRLERIGKVGVELAHLRHDTCRQSKDCLVAGSREKGKRLKRSNSRVTLATALDLMDKSKSGLRLVRRQSELVVNK